MQLSAQFLLTIGGILLLGLVLSTIARRTFLPRVTLLLVFGIIIGHEVLDIIPKLFTDRFEIIANMTLLMVGFLIGGKLSKESLRKCAGKVFIISLLAALMTACTVSLGLTLISLPTDIAIILGCIAAATAPAAVYDVVNETGEDSYFSRLLLSIVALDDVWALFLFGIGMALAFQINGSGTETFFSLALWEIGGAILLGLLIGLPAAFLSGRINPGQPMLLEALGIVFVCGGIAIWLGVSFLIASIVMGAVITNLAAHHEYPFHAIEGIEWPFMVIFFVLAGASLELSTLASIGTIGLMYIGCRIIGKYAGSWIGGHFSNSQREIKQWMGLALLPQAGVAIGMALVASLQFPEHRQLLLSLVISTTVFFELFGPLLTRIALNHSNKASDKHC